MRGMVWSPFLIRNLCFLMPTTWRPLVKRSHITVFGVIDSPCGFQPWAEATRPREWRIPPWSHWDWCPHLCINSVKTVSTPTWFRVFALPHPDSFLFCSWMPHKMWPYWLLGPARTHQVANGMARSPSVPLQLEQTSLWQSLVSVPASLWLQARSQLFSRDTVQQLLKWHGFPAHLQPTYPWELLPAHAAAACLPAWTSPLTPRG